VRQWIEKRLSAAFGKKRLQMTEIA
jgi:hypothetical protein